MTFILLAALTLLGNLVFPQAGLSAFILALLIVGVYDAWRERRPK
jgi:hypothetical protein